MITVASFTWVIVIVFLKKLLIYTAVRLFLRVNSIDSEDGGYRFLLNICNYLSVLNLQETSWSDSKKLNFKTAPTSWSSVLGWFADWLNNCNLQDGLAGELWWIGIVILTSGRLNNNLIVPYITRLVFELMSDWLVDGIYVGWHLPL